MPRAPRIEYEGAIYHIMARGDRREPIVYNDGGREVFVQTLAQACERAGWEVFASVLHGSKRQADRLLTRSGHNRQSDHDMASMTPAVDGPAPPRPRA